MRLKLATTEAADGDVRDIASYIAADNRRAAEQFEGELWSAFERIRDHADIGTPVKGYAVPLRSLRVSQRFHRYLIFYRHADEQTIEIVRILHGARDLTRLLADLG